MNKTIRPSNTLIALACLGLLAAACGAPNAPASAHDGGLGSRSDGGDAPDAATCPAEPPHAPETLACHRWTCAEAPAPDCWSCSQEAGDEGSPCEADGQQGHCRAGRCELSVDPGESGPHTVIRSSETMALPGGRRAETAIFTPQLEGRRPAIIFLHGFQLQTGLYTSYGEQLASHGFIVLMPQMPSGMLGGPSHRELGEYTAAIIDGLVADAGPLAGRIDADRIGLAGHSMGGKIAMLSAANDGRVVAVFAIDPVDAAGGPFSSEGEDYPSVTPQLMPQIRQPIGLIGETTNATCRGFGCQPCAPEAENFQQYYEHAVGPTVEIEVIGASHMSFLDNPRCGLTCSMCPAGDDDPAVTRAMTHRAITAFFQLTMEGRAAAAEHITGDGVAADIAAGRIALRSKNGL